MPQKMSNIDLKDLIELHLSSIREEIKSASELSEYKFDVIIKKQEETISHQKVTNGRVNKLEESFGEVKNKLKPVEWIDRNKKWILIVGIVSWFILDTVSKSIELIDVLNIVK